jgi:Protein of unknown function (DUF1997)
MVAEFYASESVSISVPSQLVPIAHYLRQPQRLVNAITEKSRVEELENRQALEGHRFFRMKMQPLSFLHVKIQPTVDMEVWSDVNGTVHLRSIRTQIRGTDWIDQRFALKLAGKITPNIDRHGRTKLVGRVDLKVSVAMPPIFSLTPSIVIEIAGNSLLKSVLVAMKQRLMQRLVADYVAWVKEDRNVKLTGNPAIEPA